MCEPDSHSRLACHLLTKALCRIGKLVFPSQRGRKDSQLAIGQKYRFHGKQDMDMFWAPDSLNPIPDAGWPRWIVVAW